MQAGHMKDRRTTWGRCLGWALMALVSAAASVDGVAVVGSGVELGAAFDKETPERYVIITNHMDLTEPGSCSTWLEDGCDNDDDFDARFDVPPGVHAIVVRVNTCRHSVPTGLSAVVVSI